MIVWWPMLHIFISDNLVKLWRGRSKPGLRGCLAWGTSRWRVSASFPRPPPWCIPGSPSYVPGGIRPRLCWTPEKKNHSWIILVCLGEGCLGWNTSSPDIYQDFRQKFLDLLWWRNLHDWGSEGTDRFQALTKRSKTSLHIRSIKGAQRV